MSSSLYSSWYPQRSMISPTFTLTAGIRDSGISSCQDATWPFRKVCRPGPNSSSTTLSIGGLEISRLSLQRVALDLIRSATSIAHQVLESDLDGIIRIQPALQGEATRPQRFEVGIIKAPAV
jgi:hypothetical protein